MEGYHYYWYHHGMSTVTREVVEDTINDGNYGKFVELIKKYPDNLPRRVSYFDANGDITSHGDVLDENVFKNIVYQESENG